MAKKQVGKTEGIVFEDILSHLPAAVLRCANDSNRTIYYVSSGINKITGYGSEDFIQNNKRTFASIIFYEDKERVADAIKSAIKKGSDYSTDYRIIDKKGGILWVRERGRGVTEGKTTKYLDSVITDITESKTIIEELRKSEETYKTLVEGSKQSIFIVDKNGVFRFLNYTAANALGKDLKECVGKTQWDLFPKPIADRQMESVREVIRTGRYYFGGSKVILRGVERRYETNVYPLRNPDGKVDSALAIAVDVTDYFEARAFLKEIIDGTNIPTLVLDQNHKVTYWNKAMEALTGIMRQEVLGTVNQWMLAYNEKRPILADYVLDGKIEEIEKAYRGVKIKSSLIDSGYEAVSFFSNVGGKPRWLLFTASPLKDPEGKIIGAIETAQDMTESKNAEQEVIRSKQEIEAAYEKLKELDYMKDDFLNMVAHELKTPLIPIMGYLSIIQKDESISPEFRKMLEVCMKAAARENEIIKEIMDVHRIDSGIMRYDFAQISVRETIEKAVAELKPSANKKGLEMRTEIQEDAPKVLGDSQRLMQVVTNLLINAIKFTNTGSIKVKCAKEGNDIIVTVEDTGIGISEKDIPRLFTRFFQANTGMKRQYEGTGLGLVICKGIIEAHRGKIWAESKTGVGSRFIFTLPINK